jgi:hypothetical protein
VEVVEVVAREIIQVLILLLEVRVLRPMEELEAMALRALLAAAELLVLTHLEVMLQQELEVEEEVEIHHLQEEKEEVVALPLTEEAVEVE